MTPKAFIPYSGTVVAKPPKAKMTSDGIGGNIFSTKIRKKTPK
jgi:hypothetical protein